MNLTHILILALVAFLGGWLVPAKQRGGFILAASLLAIFWLQPASPIRNLDFWFPLSAIFLTTLTWAITQGKSGFFNLSNLKQFSLIAAVVLSVASLRFFEPFCCLTGSKPPAFSTVTIILVIFFLILSIFHQAFSGNSKGGLFISFLILLLFILLKTPAFATQTSGFLRRLSGQDVTLASALDLPWLGFSYLAFRLLHTLRDFQMGKLKSPGFWEFASYALFFPTFTAGPIDRFQHFSGEMAVLQTDIQQLPLLTRLKESFNSQNLLSGFRRIITGVFKKFVLADSLALISLNQLNASQINGSFWTWVLLYAFSLRIYLDFSGYTDIAIGLGYLLGFKLPENFDHPYRKHNLTVFWNSWHITLSQWFRAYFFNPVTRALRSNSASFPVWGVIFLGQLGTMLLIGLWHGITWNFAIWGVWHGLGLFIHNRWTDWMRTHPEFLPKSASGLTLSRLLGWFVTFHFVTLGWVWFSLPELKLAIETFQKLFSFWTGI